MLLKFQSLVYFGKRGCYMSLGLWEEPDEGEGIMNIAQGKHFPLWPSTAP